MLRSVQRDLVLTVGVMTGAVLLGIVLGRDLSMGLPRVPRNDSAGLTNAPTPPVPDAERFFGPAPAGLAASTVGEVSSGFFTTYFQPPTQPPPRAPSVRKVDLTYLGFLQAGDGPRLALIHDSKAQRTVGIGAPIVADLAVAGIESVSLVLTNAAGATNSLPFRVKTTLEVPVE